MDRGKIEYVPIGDIPTSQLESIGETLHHLLTRPSLRETLLARNLLGVVERHCHSAEASVEHLKIVQRDGQAQKLSAFAIFNVIGPRTVLGHDYDQERIFSGMATIQEGLPLYVQKLPIPPKFTRNNILGQKIDTPLFNISAWTIEPFLNRPATSTDTILAGAYEFLTNYVGIDLAHAPECWTLATQIDPITDAFYKKTLERAGLERVTFQGPRGSDVTHRRFDELESSRKPAPFSALYVDRRSLINTI